MNIAVLMIATPELNFLEYCVDNTKEYCEKNKYDFLLYDKRLDQSRPVTQNKLLYVIKNIDKYDWIFMKDADSLIYNFSIRLEEFIDDEFNYIASYGRDKSTFQMGHVLIKCTEEVKQQLQNLYDTEFLKYNKERSCEQKPFNTFIREGKITKCKYLPKRILNACPNPVLYDETLIQRNPAMYNRTFINKEHAVGTILPDSFIVHWPGEDNKGASHGNFAKKELSEYISHYNYVKNKYGWK